MWMTLFAVGLLVIAGLAFYLGKLLFQLKAQQKQQQQALEAHQQKQAERQQYLLDSIVVIGKATLEQQCEPSEAALRIWVLLENMQPELAQACRWPALFEMYDLIKDMPTHDARKTLEKQELRRQDHLRQQKEIELKSAIEKDIKGLLEIIQQRH